MADLETEKVGPRVGAVGPLEGPCDLISCDLMSSSEPHTCSNSLASQENATNWGINAQNMTLWKTSNHTTQLKPYVHL